MFLLGESCAAKSTGLMHRHWWLGQGTPQTVSPALLPPGK